MRKFNIAAFFALIICCVNAVEARTFDLSQTESDSLFVILTFNGNSGLNSGIFRNIAPEGKVNVENNTVAPPGAGIFFGSKDAWAPPGSCFFFVEKTDAENGQPYRAILPIEVVNEGIWHKSVVEENTIQVDSAGNKGRYSTARPINGGIIGLKIKTQGMEKPKELSVGLKGQLDGGFVEIGSLGRREIHFPGRLNATGCYIKLDKESLVSLLKLIPNEDHESIINAHGDTVFDETNVSKIDHAINADNGNSSEKAVSNRDSKNDGFVNGIKYGISYPFVFWGAEGFVKVPLNEMTGSFSLGYFFALICVLLIAGSIFIFKK